MSNLTNISNGLNQVYQRFDKAANNVLQYQTQRYSTPAFGSNPFASITHTGTSAGDYFSRRIPARRNLQPEESFIARVMRLAIERENVQAGLAVFKNAHDLLRQTLDILK